MFHPGIELGQRRLECCALIQGELITRANRMSQHKRISNVWIAGDLRMVISARHLLATRANLRIAHERQQEKALWEEEHGSCRACDHDNNPSPLAHCDGCINGGGKFGLYQRKKKKKKKRRKR